PHVAGSLTARVRNARALRRGVAGRAFGSSRETLVDNAEPSSPTRTPDRPRSNQYPGSLEVAADAPSGPYNSALRAIRHCRFGPAGPSLCCVRGPPVWLRTLGLRLHRDFASGVPPF